MVSIIFFVNSESGGGSVSVGLGSSYGVEKDCLLSEENGRGLENDLRRDENFEVWEYRSGNCRGYNRYGKYPNYTMYRLLL